MHVELSQWARRTPLERDSEAYLAQDILRGIVETVGGTLKVSREGLYRYDSASGVWCLIERKQIKSLAQVYDGAARSGKSGLSPINISASRAQGIADCVLHHPELQDPTFFDERRRGVAFANGFVVVDAETVKIEPHAPENKATFAYDIDFDGTASNAEITQFLSDVFIDNEDRKERRAAIQQFLGACLIGVATQYARTLALLGDGNNGKSILQDVIRHMFPPGAFCSITPHRLDDQYAVATLAGKAINLVTEVPAKEMLDTSVFKAIITGDHVTGRHPYERPFVFKPFAGHVLNLNSTFNTSDLSHGFWRRLLVVGFDRRYDDKDPTRRNPEELTSAILAEKQGVLSWALWGARDLIKQNAYTVPPSHHDAITAWQERVDIVRAFYLNCTSPADNGGTNAADLWRAQKDYAERVGRPWVSLPEFGVRSRLIHGRPKKNSTMRYPVELLDRTEWKGLN